MPATPPPAPPQQARQTPAVMVVLVRLLAQRWGRLSAFLRGPGLAAAMAALKTTGVLLAKMWAQLEIAFRRLKPKPDLLPRRETQSDLRNAEPRLPEDALPALPPMGRIPPHQRHIYAHLNNG
jgi:transposase InsO family protein